MIAWGRKIYDKFYILKIVMWIEYKTILASGKPLLAPYQVVRFIEHVSMDKYVLYNKFSTEEFALVFKSADEEPPGHRQVIVRCQQYDTTVCSQCVTVVYLLVLPNSEQECIRSKNEPIWPQRQINCNNLSSCNSLSTQNRFYTLTKEDLSNTLLICTSKLECTSTLCQTASLRFSCWTIQRTAGFRYATGARSSK